MLEVMLSARLEGREFSSKTDWGIWSSVESKRQAEFRGTVVFVSRRPGEEADLA